MEDGKQPQPTTWPQAFQTVALALVLCASLVAIIWILAN